MKKNGGSLRTASLAVLGAAVWLSCGPATAAEDEGVQFFREKIEPVLKAHCYECHSAASSKVRGGLRLDSRPGILRGGDSGEVIMPGQAGKSLLIQALRHENGLEMPPEKDPLPERVIADFVKWIELNTPDPRDAEPEVAADARARQHWAFQPVRSAVPPTVRDTGWVRNPLDAFVLARLEEQQWSPAEPATRVEWIRRVTFDLTGLPPTPAEIETFVADSSEQAWERVVARLLESPHYGERWAQHWLDVIRYAESEGYEYDAPLPDAWRFRDYVVDSLNRDKPFDQFAKEQLAGDELRPDDAEYQVAAIFHRLGPVRRNAGNPDIALSRNEVLTERTDVIATAFLALTVGCARCHNHKLEPISQKDYYRLQAYLAATDEHNISLAAPGELEIWEQKTAELKARLQELKQLVAASSGAEKLRLESELDAFEAQMPAPLPTIPSTHNNTARRTAIHVLKRGVWEQKGEPVGPRPPSILVADDLPELASDVEHPRTQLAEWLVSREHPLTSRVIVNRVWQEHFGVGIVPTANDFGTRGTPPSHPELLDWLATTLVENGWRLKPLHRLIVLSSTYRQSGRSAFAAEARAQDPANRLLWHFPRRRLSAEEIRDTMLAVSGRLNRQAGGPSVMVPVDPELVQLLYKPWQWQVPADRKAFDRRSIYLSAKRNLRLPFLEAFDAPARLASCPQRQTSTHAPQALEMLNGTLSNDLAGAFAARLRRDAGDAVEKRIDRAFQLAIGRRPTPQEQELSRQFLLEEPLEEFALAIFNLNEFQYVP